MPLNLSRIRSYAPKARRDFIAAVANKAAKLGITEKGSLAIEPSGSVVIIGGHAYPKYVGEQRARLISRIATEGYQEVIEQIAYTWFNRLAALRFMEIHEYLGHPYRVLSAPSDPDGLAEPEILKHATQVDLKDLNRAAIEQATLEGNREEEIYRSILVAQCNALNAAMPFLFEKIGDETELLLPDGLLATDGLVRKLVMSIPEESWKEIEIIGWLYQSYISEKKDHVFAGLKNNQKITAENIPAATQLFTPHWIVRYLVENSLGRLWLLNNPSSRLASKMNYYIAPEEPEPGFVHISTPEEIRICDPACGSGHMLTYAFDLLYEIYEEKGYQALEIPGLILKHNLTGIEIDDRAGALAGFALSMKAAAKLGRRRFLQMEATPNIVVLQNVGFTPGELRELASKMGRQLFTDELNETLGQFEQAKNFGSLIRPKLHDPAETMRLVDARDFESDLLLKEVKERVMTALRMAAALSPIYHVVVANPPYMNSGGMNDALKMWGKTAFPQCWGKGRSDTFAMFIERGLALVPAHGFSAMVTMESWMFLGTFRELREKILDECTILTMIHMPYLGKGGTSMGINFGTSAFILQKVTDGRWKGHFSCIRHHETDNEGIPFSFPVQNERLALASARDFKKLPSSPISYWLSEAAKACFERYPSFDEKAVACQGLATTDNNRFVRQWTEVDYRRCGFGCQSSELALASRKKWFPMDKGGNYRRWYGNNFAVVNWEADGKEIRGNITRKYPYLNGNPDFVAKNPGKYFLPGVTWGKITSGTFSARFSPEGSIFSDAGMKAFPLKKDDSPLPILGLLNSKVAPFFLASFSETMNFEQGNISRIPFADVPVDHLESIVGLSKCDWDDREISWDFTGPPLLSPKHRAATLPGTYALLRTHWQSMTDQMQKLETENNRIFIEAYGLQQELNPEVPVEEISLTCNPAYRYGVQIPDAEAEDRLREDTFKELVSYAIGCMMGRYSLSGPGLTYANSDGESFDLNAYGPFAVDDDGIVPVTERYWFDDDSAARFVEFLEVVFGGKTRDENLIFVAGTLSPKRGEAPVETIRRYLSRSFFKDHLQIYKKRPIYWLFSSGTERAFECLVYLHRFNGRTLARMRAKYVTPLQSKMHNRLESLRAAASDNRSSSAEKSRLREIDALQRQLHELSNFDDRLRQAIDQNIRLDLDDGIRDNYRKLRELLAEADTIIGKKGDGDDE